MNLYEPAVKWSGSKRSQAKEILTHFPQKIDTYYEPFCGSAAVFNRLAHSDIYVCKYILSDANNDLIDLFKEIKSNPGDVCAHYEKLWHELNEDADLERKKQYFAEIRSRFNEEHDPKDFMFIMRTCTNGMPRYNRDGNFNNSFHVTRNGIDPVSLWKIVYAWSEVLNGLNVDLYTCDYEQIQPGKNDFMYLDPPYFNTKGMYYGRIDYDKLWNYLEQLECKWVLSFDGISGDADNTCEIPKIYDEHYYLKSGNSSFKRVIGKSRDSVVYESLYVKN